LPPVDFRFAYWRFMGISAGAVLVASLYSVGAAIGSDGHLREL
jgi:hypothetical protein